jgi:hypothetical protein
VPREEEGRLSPTAVVDRVETYQAGAGISQLAVDFGIHRPTVAAHLDRQGVNRDRDAVGVLAFTPVRTSK